MLIDRLPFAEGVLSIELDLFLRGFLEYFMRKMPDPGNHLSLVEVGNAKRRHLIIIIPKVFDIIYSEFDLISL